MAFNNKHFANYLQKTNPIVLPKKPDTMNITRCVVIDSRDRNRTKFPNSNRFSVAFNPSNTYQGAAINENIFKNIKMIKLVECIVPKIVIETDNISYLTLRIPELEDNLHGTNSNLNKAFAILLPDRVMGDFCHFRVREMCHCFRQFHPPKASINRLTFEFYDRNGELYDFGTDTTPPTAVDDSKNIMMVFEMVMIGHNVEKLNSQLSL